MEKTGLELIYFPSKQCLHFASEDIQTLIIRAIDISVVIHFSMRDLETGVFIPNDELPAKFNTFFDLIQDAENSLRNPGFIAEFKSGIKLAGDFNLTYIYATNTESLFEFSSLIFDAFNLNKLDSKEVLLNNPSHIIRFTNKNDKMKYKIIPFS